MYCHRAGYNTLLVLEVSHTEQWGESVECSNSTSSSPQEEINSARAGQRRLQTPRRKDWLVCRSPSRKTPQKLLLLQRLTATSRVRQPDSQLERWKATLVTFISQHMAAPYCNVHLSFPGRERKQTSVYSVKEQTKAIQHLLRWETTGWVQQPSPAEGKRVVTSLPREKTRQELRLKSGKFDFIRVEELTTAILVSPAINHNLELQLQ